MLDRLRKSNRVGSADGFTLIELLIVIVILGILAAIVVFAIGGTRGDAVASSCVTNVKQYQLSAEAVLTKKGYYPTAPGDLLASAAGNLGGIMKSLPTSNDYTITYAGAATPDKTYTITIGGTGVVGGAALTQTSDDAAVNAECKGK